MLTSMKTIRDWLHEVEVHQDDTSWLSQREDKLYAVVAGSIYRQSEFHDAVDLLLRVFAYYGLVLYHGQRWSHLLLQALTQAHDLRNSEMQIRILTYMGESYLTGDKQAAARAVFEIALERAQEGNSKEMMLATMIGLIRMQSISMGDEYDPNLLTQALKLSQEIDDLSLKGALHQSLTLAYTYRYEYEAAIEHGQIAYVYWHFLGNEMEMAKTLYLLSAAYRFMWRLQRAEDLLQIASEQFGNTDYNRQYSMLAYEAGAVYLQRKEFEVAAQWLILAQKEAITIDYSQVIAASTHALGLAQTGLGQYTVAAKNLNQAIVVWEKLDNFYELANAHQALGNLENKRKQPERALESLQKALELCMKTPPSNQRTWLEGHIRETIDEIPW